ncbi:MAG TPA: hypothetical protein VEY71_13105 [Chitinophagales bacterium]|nr:hypothetical protein [Chitinophagales bacterium]
MRILNTQSVLAAIIGAVAFFILAWLVFGFLMIDFYLSNIIPYDGLVKDPPVIWSLFIHGLSLTALLTFVFEGMGIRTFSKGFLASLVVGFLITLYFYSFNYASLNLYTGTRIVVDLVVNSLFSAVVGGITAQTLGFLYSRKKTSVPVTTV